MDRFVEVAVFRTKYVQIKYYDKNNNCESERENGDWIMRQLGIM